MILAGASTVLDPKARDDNLMVNKKLKGISDQIKGLEVNFKKFYLLKARRTFFNISN